MMIQQSREKIQNVEIAKALARRMRQPTAQDRAELARTGLALLKQVEPENGETTQVRRAANRLANSLKIEYGNPEKCTEAAIVATELRSFARGITPFGALVEPMVDTLCLS